jgi:hypothetical protein
MSGFFPGSSNSQVPRTGAELEDLTFGHTQLYKSVDSVWLFLDVDEVSPSSGSEGALVKQRGFAAIQIVNSCTPRVWRSDEDHLTAHANFTDFVESGGSVYAVRRDRKLAWKLTLNNATEQDAPRDVGSVVKVDYQGLAFVGDLERAQYVSALKLVDTGNYGYGQFPPAASLDTRRTQRLSFQSFAHPHAVLLISANHTMQPSGEVGRFEVEGQPSPPADRSR